MKNRFGFLLAASLVACGCGDGSGAPANADAELSSRTILRPIPAPFRNVWAVETADCSRIDGPTRVNIDPSTISFHEGRFDVVSLDQSGEEQLLLGVRFEGGPLQTHILKLSNQFETLSYTGPEILRTLHRCRT
ncbi:MAG: hypothetical protein Q8R82_03740 [Hyphomonadaceae bacterium]|nr:hypothetical protein [Hyphomonadaceae bacterium]